MALDLLKDRGTPLAAQRFTLRELSPPPTSKLDDDAFTRVRIILLNGIEQDANRFMHICARMNGGLRERLAIARRAHHHQQTIVNWLLPADLSPLETTIAYEQVAIEVTASIAQREPDPYFAQVYRFGLLEDFDHMYRYSALMDRVEGKDANNILQCYTDVMPGRPTKVEHRAPVDDLRRPYDKAKAHPFTKMNALTLTSGEYQTRDYYMTVGPQFADPVARNLYAEIASIEEQHVTQYESILDPDETWVEKWLIYEANAAWNYWSCVQYEGDARVKAIWERFLDYQLGKVRFVADVLAEVEGRDAAEILSDPISDALEYKSQRAYVRGVLEQEVNYRAVGTDIGALVESKETLLYREYLNSKGSPSETVAAGYLWTPGTELSTPAGGPSLEVSP